MPVVFTSVFLMMHLVLLFLETVYGDLLLLQLQIDRHFDEMPVFEVMTCFFYA